jgi:hypothetical protein
MKTFREFITEAKIKPGDGVGFVYKKMEWSGEIDSKVDGKWKIINISPESDWKQISKENYVLVGDFNIKSVDGKDR